jgi:hypothetical protein
MNHISHHLFIPWLKFFVQRCGHVLRWCMAISEDQNLSMNILLRHFPLSLPSHSCHHTRLEFLAKRHTSSIRRVVAIDQENGEEGSKLTAASVADAHAAIKTAAISRVAPPGAVLCSGSIPYSAAHRGCPNALFDASTEM